ncbi:TetR/AcrR family transcriptional regulator [Luteimicrobium subarcticum]|uniref:TetR family transcriptional regulator n=1 Tax=Luteimicrobium subarcticum TaxID=620910 RepID=A0A2M8WUS2_9MICO|nr:TetR family transcriptional regulator [Luteimicrobium subarcticum]PJI94673.1 TetR family transcriptional regulator [Luteimicrobium subarcticum]
MSPRVSEEYREARRTEILDAARARFARDGFHQTSMDDVIREAGLSAGAVYGYFPSKTALVHAVVDDALARVLRAFDAASAEITQTAGDPGAEPLDGAEVAGAVVDRVMQLLSGAGIDTSRIALFAWAETMSDEELRVQVAARLVELRGRLRGLVTAAPWNPSAPVPDDAADDAALALLAAPIGTIVQRHVVGDADGAALARGLAALARSWAPRP